MTARPAKKEDWDSLLKLHKGHSFPFPSFLNMLDVVVIENDKQEIVAWGYTEKLVEAVFVPNIESPSITKVKALKSLTDKLGELTKARGIEQIHSFIQDDRFAELLVKRFNYGVCSGTPLYLNLNDNG